MARLIFLDDDPDLARALDDACDRLGHDSVAVRGPRAVLDAVLTAETDLVVVDWTREESGRAVVALLASEQVRPPLVAITGYGDALAVEAAARAGALAWTHRPLQPALLDLALASALTLFAATRDAAAWKAEAEWWRTNVAAVTAPTVLRAVQVAASALGPVVIEGDPHAGRRVARLIHARSRRATAAFVEREVADDAALALARNGTLVVERIPDDAVVVRAVRAGVRLMVCTATPMAVPELFGASGATVIRLDAP
jgi:DNA-binding NtrC family response regulator